MTDVVIPKWGLTMEDAVLVGWLKSVGDRVEQGEPLAEIETDKATGQLESPTVGTLREIHAREGDEVEPGQVIGRIEDG
ncbi:MAG: biotin attachment protein [Streptosporangiales bacterium]|nr:biotin attachment protein [Streptosporangiales bacterium]